MRDKILEQIRVAQMLNEVYISKYPFEHRFQLVKKALEQLGKEVRDHWPLTHEEKRKVNIGVYAARELEEQADDLAGKLEILDYDIKHEADVPLKSE